MHPQATPINLEFNVPKPQEITCRKLDLGSNKATSNLIWQDVYYANLESGLKAYIKLTLRENGIVVIQFKEK